MREENTDTWQEESDEISLEEAQRQLELQAGKPVIFLEHVDLKELKKKLKERGFQQIHYYKVETSQFYVFKGTDCLLITQTDNLSRTLLLFRQVNYVRIDDMMSELDLWKKGENPQLIRTNKSLRVLLRDWFVNKINGR